jgi:hypothetical protein
MEGPQTPIAACMCYLAGCEWHFGEIASSQATIAEAISLAKELNDMHALAQALGWAAGLAANEGNPAEVEHFASEMIELSTRHNFLHFQALGAKPFTGVGHAALPVRLLKAFRGSSRE